MKIGYLLLALLAGPVSAGDTTTWQLAGHLTAVRIQPTTEPGAAAELIYFNDYANGLSDNSEISEIEMGRIKVRIRYSFNASPTGADRIDVEVPEGYFARPSSLTLEERQEGRILIYALESVGM